MKSSFENLIQWTKLLKKTMKGKYRKDLDKAYVRIIPRLLRFSARQTIVKIIEKPG